MKGILICMQVIALILGLSGCKKSTETDRLINPIEQTSTKLSLNLPMANVDIIDYEISTQPKRIFINMDVAWPDGSTTQRKLTIESQASAFFDIASKSSLTDETNEILFEYLFEMDTTGTDFRITERTQSDEMAIEYRVESGVVTESYIINGNSKEFTYPNIGDDVKRVTIDFYNDFKNTEAMTKMLPVEPPKVSDEYFQVIASFDEFYSPSIGNTLHNNQEGELLTYLISNEDFSSWLEQILYPEGNLKTAEGWKKKICALCDICALLKCTYGGGPANNVCNACIACAVVCRILDYYS